MAERPWTWKKWQREPRRPTGSVGSRCRTGGKVVDDREVTKGNSVQGCAGLPGCCHWSHRLSIGCRLRAVFADPSSPLPSHKPEPITERIVQVLPELQVALGGLDRGTPQADLDLHERRPAVACELGEGPPQVVRRDLAEADTAGISHDRLEDRAGPVADEGRVVVTLLGCSRARSRT